MQQSYEDLTTLYGATHYSIVFIDYDKWPVKLQNDITLKYFKAGHMMYQHKGSMIKFCSELVQFLE